MKNTMVHKIVHWGLMALIMTLLLGCCIPMSPSMAPEQNLTEIITEEMEKTQEEPAADTQDAPEDIPEDIPYHPDEFFETQPSEEPEEAEPEEPQMETVAINCSRCGGFKICPDCSDGICIQCGGHGTEQCDKCLDGECMTCSGDKYIYVDNFYSSELEKVKCTTCRGSGKCGYCENGIVQCSKCRGSKRCTSCGGSEECPYCSGKGIVGTAVQEVAPTPESTAIEGGGDGLYIAHGTTGSLTWELWSDNMLTISGSGDMPDYHGARPAPWSAYTDNIHRVIVGNGISSVGDEAFLGCSSITEMELPGTLVEIGSNAFSGCTGIDEMTIPASVNTLGISVFRGWTSSQTIYFESSALNPTKKNTVSGIAYRGSAIWKNDCSANIVWP